MDFTESKTYQNLLKTIDGEMKASTKYSIYSGVAREDGYENVGDFFEETSHNEKEHAERLMKIIYNGLPHTLDNLADASKGEQGEWTNMYPEFARIAKEEGYDQISELFLDIAEVERHHNYRYDMLAKNIKNNQMFCKEENILWICMNCGYLYYGECAPEVCPLCGFPQSFFKPNCEDY